LHQQCTQAANQAVSLAPNESCQAPNHHLKTRPLCKRRLQVSPPLLLLLLSIRLRL
jgi:hypothetical protein